MNNEVFSKLEQLRDMAIAVSTNTTAVNKITENYNVILKEIKYLRRHKALSKGIIGITQQQAAGLAQLIEGAFISIEDESR